MTKEQERDELHRTIWQIANDLRGSVDGWDFKAYIVGNIVCFRNLEKATNESIALFGDKEACGIVL
jgi:type I restriction-modification system DNA methylase subunit